MRPPAAALEAVAFAALALGLLFVVPAAVEPFALNDLTLFIAMAVLALSLAFVWGAGGILCFGQSAFFGLGAYAYAVAAINLGDSTPAILLAVALPVLLALVLGYFMFWGRVSDVYLAVITLAVSLVFYYLIGASAGGEYRIGKAPLGGYNGIPSVPSINAPGDPAALVEFEDLYFPAALLLVLVYGGLRLALASRFGRVVVSIRENETRAELLGYDARRHKLAVLAVGAGVAGVAGALFAAVNNYVSPTVFSLFFTAQIIMWLLVGGLGSLFGAVIGCVLIQYLTTWLGETKYADVNLVLGAIFVAIVLFVPRGIVPMIGQAAAARFRRAGGPGP